MGPGFRRDSGTCPVSSRAGRPLPGRELASRRSAVSNCLVFLSVNEDDGRTVAAMDVLAPGARSSAAASGKERLEVLERSISDKEHHASP